METWGTKGEAYQATLRRTTLHNLMMGFVTGMFLTGSTLAWAVDYPGAVIQKGNPMAALGFPDSPQNLPFESTRQELTLQNYEILTKDGASALLRQDQNLAFYSGYGVRKHESILGENLKFSFAETNFGLVNSAYWMGRLVDQVKALQFLKNQKMKIIVDTHCDELQDNAHYDQLKNNICLGHLYDVLDRNAMGGGAAAAYDADVSVHELAHGVFNHLAASLPSVILRQYGSLGNDLLGALNEGQADFQAHTITGTELIAPWFVEVFKENIRLNDPQSYPSVKDLKGLRKLTSSRGFLKVEDYGGEIHSDGEIFGSSLRSLGRDMGTDNALKVWLEAISRISESDGLAQYAGHVEAAERTHFQGRYKDAVARMITQRGWRVAEAASLERLNMKLQFIDASKVMTAIQKIFKEKLQKDLPTGTVHSNGNGKLEAGECAVLTFQLENADRLPASGVEIFIPGSEFLENVTNVLSNRFYLGVVEAGQKVPQTTELKSLLGPWLYLCADSSYSGDRSFKIMIQDNSGRPAVTKTISM